MKNYSTHVKSVLDNCIGEMTLNSWLYVKKLGVDFTKSRKMNFDDTMKFLISKQKNSTQEELLNFYSMNLLHLFPITKHLRATVFLHVMVLALILLEIQMMKAPIFSLIHTAKVLISFF